MIEIRDRLCILETARTSYLIWADPAGNPVQLYYGRRLDLRGDALKALMPRTVNQNGTSLVADPSQPAVCLDDLCLELSGRGKGDQKEPFVELTLADGSRSSDFRFVRARKTEKQSPAGLPGAYGDEGSCSLALELADRNSDARLTVFYTVYEECDCITRFARLTNEGDTTIWIDRLMSAQLDLPLGQIRVSSFHGEWTREMNRYDTLLQAGKLVSESNTGFSSNRANPFVMYAGPAATETSGTVYATNLLYSGSHREVCEIGSHGKLRILTGINPAQLRWKLNPGESFDSPEAVLTRTDDGYEGISTNMHAFVRRHIVRGFWQFRERPVLINSWEAMYFNVTERRLLKLARAAKDIGIELFVLDDGWFGKRNSDTCSLGDWQDNTEKLPGGLRGLSEKIHAMGLQFGVWVEPEMVNEDSELYRQHPDWAVRIPGREQALGRNQMLLDLTRQEVRAYLVEAMTDVFTRGQVQYVKWDMNRHMSDLYSQALPPEQQGEFAHRYILGLYQVLTELTAAFPEVLFEGCASGGNRFDLGMLCYMPQIWASDCTDARQRGLIQNGYSYGYPQSVYTAHVSGSPNHQTLRKTLPETRFAVACAAVLGYEVNLCDAGQEDLQEMQAQIGLYKRWRKTLQFGRLYRLRSGPAAAYGGLSPEQLPELCNTDLVRWMIVDETGERGVGVVLQDRCIPNLTHHSFRARGLKPDAMYRFYNRCLKYDVRMMGDLINTASPIHIRQDSAVHRLAAHFYKLDGETEALTVSGALLNEAGVQLAQSYGGTGLAPDTALYPDDSARLYFMEETDGARE